MKYIIAIAFMIFISAQVVAQTTTTDSIQLTELQMSKIAKLQNDKAELQKQFDQMKQEIERQISEHLGFILDANGIEPKSVIPTEVREGKLFYKKKTEGK